MLINLIHTGNEPVLGFRSHSHVCNNNRELLIQFCQSLRLSCLNTFAWGGSLRESPTFCFDFGDRYVESIFGHSLVSSFFHPQVIDFQVHSEGDWEMNSDHTSLLISVSLSREVRQAVPLHRGQLGRICRWGKFTGILEIGGQHPSL